jgi:hypothetical protein
MSLNESLDRHLFEIKAVLGKCKGIFAKIDIPHGTRILAKSSLPQTGIYPAPEAAGDVDILPAFNQLSEPGQRSCLALHPFASEEVKK